MNRANKGIFISYAREDAEAARRLYRDLKAEGLDVWLDQESLLPGQDWQSVIRLNIANCRYFLALLSHNSVNKIGYVQKELKEAMKILDKYPPSEIFIIPIRLEDCTPLHEKLNDLQWADMFPDWDYGYRKILSVINNLKDQEDDEIRQSRVWISSIIKGRWDGQGKWNLEDRTWIGHGLWEAEGTLLFGSWNAKGIWEPKGDGFGDWIGDGVFFCNMGFARGAQRAFFIVGGLLLFLYSSYNYFLGYKGLNAIIVTALIIMGITLLIIWITRSTTKGKARLNGTWQDIGEFRILDIEGYARLGHHYGIIRGKMKNPRHK